MVLQESAISLGNEISTLIMHILRPFFPDRFWEHSTQTCGRDQHDGTFLIFGPSYHSCFVPYHPGPPLISCTVSNAGTRVIGEGRFHQSDAFT
jgi:hypothetical protein